MYDDEFGQRLMDSNVSRAVVLMQTLAKPFHVHVTFIPMTLPLVRHITAKYVLSLLWFTAAT